MSRTQAIADARAALLASEERGARRVLGPCPHDVPVCAHAAAAFPQAVATPRGGPPFRSARGADAGAVRPPRATTIERVAYFNLARAPPAAAPDDAVRARVVATPRKRSGHVLLDVCTSSGASQTLTLSRAALNRADGGATFKDARKATAGSLLTFRPAGAGD